VSAHIVFRLRHRLTGHIIEGSQRSVFSVRDGLIAKIDIYEDAPRIEAFMRMTAQRLLSGLSADMPALWKLMRQRST
jgi:hypothetical protein